MQPKKDRAPRNRTLIVADDERQRLLASIQTLPNAVDSTRPPEGVGLGDFKDWLPLLPAGQVDLLFLDPPYNLTKSFNGRTFNRRDVTEYTDWLAEVISGLVPALKPTATVYICGDWLTSQSIYQAASDHLIVRNRITWEREKGRGAKTNWKNASEDIWFCTLSDEYTFNVEDVKLRRRVMAPYTDENGAPKDWRQTAAGGFRDTHPSNLWTDISIPFWSMPENTDHPTQKSEKLLAKLILASTKSGDYILDPFLGSGTTTAVARKLGRRGFGIEIDLDYCLLAAKRLALAEVERDIRGYEDGVFWERNTLAARRHVKASGEQGVGTLF